MTEPIVRARELGSKKSLIVERIDGKPFHEMRIASHANCANHRRDSSPIPVLCKKLMECHFELRKLGRKRARISKCRNIDRSPVLNCSFGVMEFGLQFGNGQAGKLRVSNRVRPEFNASSRQLMNLIPGKAGGVFELPWCISNIFGW